MCMNAYVYMSVWYVCVCVCVYSMCGCVCVYMCVCMSLCVYTHGTHVEVRGQLAEISSLHMPCISFDLNSGQLGCVTYAFSKWATSLLPYMVFIENHVGTLASHGNLWIPSISLIENQVGSVASLSRDSFHFNPHVKQWRSWFSEEEGNKSWEELSQTHRRWNRQGWQALESKVLCISPIPIWELLTECEKATGGTLKSLHLCSMTVLRGAWCSTASPGSASGRLPGYRMAFLHLYYRVWSSGMSRKLPGPAKFRLGHLPSMLFSV